MGQDPCPVHWKNKNNFSYVQYNTVLQVWIYSKRIQIFIQLFNKLSLAEQLKVFRFFKNIFLRYLSHYVVRHFFTTTQEVYRLFLSNF